MAVQAKRKAWELTLLAVVTVLLLSACKSSDTEEEEPVKQSPVLNIYVYTPDNPTVTRADVGYVTAADAERAVNSLHIWVFTHETTPRFVGYLNPGSSDIRRLSSSDQNTAVYQMLVPDWFTETKPNVDVYVMANVTAANCGLSLQLDKDTKRADLDAILIKKDETEGGKDYFGLTTLPATTGAVVQAVPDDGLPMSGVLKDLVVKGDAPVLRIVRNSDDDNMAIVNLVRAVSKIRFIFSKSTSNEQPIIINSVTLEGGVLPTGEFLFLNNGYTARSSRVVKDGNNATIYEPNAATLVSNVDGNDIRSCLDPSAYSFRNNEKGQDYETRINEGLKAHTVESVTTPAELSELGRFYLRESDTKLTGTISYTVDGNRRDATFTMAADGDFSRNHTWIVYAYFLGGDLLTVYTVDVKQWEETPEDRDVYNW